ncbi:unnamed protein product [Gordionus sp. m RMFG-2023]
MNALNLSFTLSPGDEWKCDQPCMKCMCSSYGLETNMECHTCGTFSSPCVTVDKKALYPDCCPRPCSVMSSQNTNINFI